MPLTRDHKDRLIVALEEAEANIKTAIMSLYKLDIPPLTPLKPAKRKKQKKRSRK